MPIYEYICKKCEHEFEQLMLKSDDKPQCPKCKSADIQKRMSACATPGVKGGGCAGSCGSCSGCGH